MDRHFILANSPSAFFWTAIWRRSAGAHSFNLPAFQPFAAARSGGFDVVLVVQFTTSRPEGGSIRRPLGLFQNTRPGEFHRQDFVVILDENSYYSKCDPRLVCSTPEVVFFFTLRTTDTKRAEWRSSFYYFYCRMC